jgi:hypothetical protein
MVISFKPLNPTEYKNGFKKPKDGKPALRRASFNKETNPAKVGAEQEVPPMSVACPSRKIL